MTPLKRWHLSRQLKTKAAGHGESILKIELTGFPNGIKVHYERKKIIKNNTKGLFLKFKQLVCILPSVRRIVLNINYY